MKSTETEITEDMRKVDLATYSGKGVTLALKEGLLVVQRRKGMVRIEFFFKEDWMLIRTESEPGSLTAIARLVVPKQEDSNET